MDGEFCVVCGATDRPLADGVCPECAAGRTTLVAAPAHAVVTVCPGCGARLVGRHWEPSDAGDRLTARDLHPLLRPDPEVGIRRVRYTELGGSALQRELEGSVDVRFRGTERTVPVRFTVRLEHRSCPACSRRSGRYYTAILQLRGPVGSRENPRARRERLDRQWTATLPHVRATFREALSWKEERPEGWDLFLTDTLAARAIARLLKERLRADLKESATLWGRKDGRDVYRVTFRLRIPAPPPVERHP